MDKVAMLLGMIIMGMSPIIFVMGTLLFLYGLGVMK